MLKIYELCKENFLDFLDPSPFPATILPWHKQRRSRLRTPNNAYAISLPEMVRGLVNFNTLLFTLADLAHGVSVGRLSLFTCKKAVINIAK